MVSSVTACSSPLRARSASDPIPISSMPRTRLNSRDIPRTYSGLYGNTDGDLLPFELNRHPAKFNHVWVILYLTILAVVQFASMLIMPQVGDSWTLTNFVHAMVTLGYIHWLKGSIYDDSGEMEALTLWEQLEATQDTRHVRETLMVLPCLLAWVACHAADYEKKHVWINVVLWVISMVGKLPFMNGVRLFGINRTAGIDDTSFLSANDDVSIVSNGDGSFSTMPNTEAVPQREGSDRSSEEFKKTQ